MSFSQVLLLFVWCAGILREPQQLVVPQRDGAKLLMLPASLATSSCWLWNSPPVTIPTMTFHPDFSSFPGDILLRP